jgi:hypothetical protein
VALRPDRQAFRRAPPPGSPACSQSSASAGGAIEDAQLDRAAGIVKARCYECRTGPPCRSGFQNEKAELPALLAANVPVDMSRHSIFGHSMGGHGALTNPDPLQEPLGLRADGAVQHRT